MSNCRIFIVINNLIFKQNHYFLWIHSPPSWRRLEIAKAAAEIKTEDEVTEADTTQNGDESAKKKKKKKKNKEKDAE